MVVEIVDPEKEYNVVFGNMVIDLSTISIDELRDNIQINTIFGNTLIKVNPEIPTDKDKPSFEVAIPRWINYRFRRPYP